MSIWLISTEQLRRMEDQEGLVLQGCGGDPQEWVDGINEILAQEGILKKGAGFEEAYSCECFDGNREYLRRRALEESNPQVRSILEQDREMLSQMQSEMSNARQFYLVMRFRNLKPEMVFTSINEARKRMAEKGFEAHRLTKPELKRFLAIYLEASMDGDKLPDVDGGQYGKGATKNG